MVKSSADGLLSIVNDLLDFSKLERGELDFSPVRFNLRECLGRTLEPWRLRATERGLDLISKVDPAVPEMMVGDPSRLSQVLVNLVSNAIKFTKHGEIVVSAAPQPTSSNDEVLHFTVRDTGVGSPKTNRRSSSRRFRKLTARRRASMEERASV